MAAFETQRFGNYILTAHLGRGGMADVFRAQRQGVAGFERTVVVKRILPSYNDDPTFVQMFINEAKIAAKLTHPNIAQVYELGEVDGEYFMAMEYVKGKDLLHVLRYLAKMNTDRRAVPPDVAAYVARETCRALSHAHDHTDGAGGARPIIHRDVSPQNIMVAYDGQVKLVDFGIAKAMMSAREETRTGALKGKIAYMSPEQVAGTSPGPESDVFSTGVVLYEMLIGRRLFKGQNDFDTLARVKSMPIPPPSRVASWVPRELDTVVMRALERDRAQRYKRAASMARDLDEYLQSIRFSMDQMAEYMAATFPPDARDEVPDGTSRTPEPSGSRAGTPSKSSARSKSRPLLDSHGMTNPGTPSAMASHRSASATPTGTGGRKTLFVAVALALLVGVGGALLAVGPLRSDRRPKSDDRALPATRPQPASAPLAAQAPDMAAPAVEPPSVARPIEPAPPVHDHARPTRPSRPHPPATPSTKPKIEVFEDGEKGTPKIETFE